MDAALKFAQLGTFARGDLKRARPRQALRTGVPVGAAQSAPYDIATLDSDVLSPLVPEADAALALAFQRWAAEPDQFPLLNLARLAEVVRHIAHRHFLPSAVIV